MQPVARVPPPAAKLSSAEWATVLAAAFASAAASVANIVALCWFGMWMGISSKKRQHRHTPDASLCAGYSVDDYWHQLHDTGRARVPAVSFGWCRGVLLLSVSKDFGCGSSLPPQRPRFILLSRRKLFSSFRAQALKGISPPVLAIPPAISSPPIIPSPAT